MSHSIVNRPLTGYFSISAFHEGIWYFKNVGTRVGTVGKFDKILLGDVYIQNLVQRKISIGNKFDIYPENKLPYHVTV